MWYVVVCYKFRCIKEFSKSIMDGKCASRKEKYTFLRRQRIFICSDLEKYKYTPGDHKSAENIGSPGHYFLLPFIEMCVLTNDFPLVQVREGLPEGKGLFSKTDIPRYTFLCNYGGTLLSKQEGADYMDRGGDFCYLYEFSFEKNGRSSTFFYNHTGQTISLGKFINHSRRHANALPRVFFRYDAKPEIMFISLRKIAAGEEIIFDYGRLYKGVNNCVSSCPKCKFLYKNNSTVY